MSRRRSGNDEKLLFLSQKQVIVPKTPSRIKVLVSGFGSQSTVTHDFESARSFCAF